MQQVTCPQCNSRVGITPDEPLCSVCQVDLRTLLAPVETTRYFYERARNFAARGEVQSALAEVNRGLDYEDDSDLRLLGAILAKRAGDYDQMRAHVAAIPVDDALRAEGEWLIRSHQERQMAEQMGQKVRGSASGALPLTEQGGSRATRRGGSWPVWIGLALVVALLFFLFSMLLNGGAGDADIADSTAPIAQPAAVDGSAAGGGNREDAAPDGTGGDALPSDGDEGRSSESGTEDSEGAIAGDSAPTPSPQPTSTPEVDFDFTDFLMARGYTGLAALGVEGELEDGVLTLVGAVPTAEDRDLLIEVARQAPGLVELNTDRFRLDPPATYVVQSGDTLWSISFSIYGDTIYMDDIYRLNRDRLPSAEILVVGMELDLPRVETEE